MQIPEERRNAINRKPRIPPAPEAVHWVDDSHEEVREIAHFFQNRHEPKGKKAEKEVAHDENQREFE